jgi:hypothetical protein
MEEVVVLPLLAARDFRADAPDAGAADYLAVPGAVICAFPDQRVQFAPVVRRDRVYPTVEILQDHADAPTDARVAHAVEMGKGLLDAAVRLGRVRPAGVLRQPRARRASGRVQVAHGHVVQQDVMQPPRAQAPAHEMRVRVQDGRFIQGFEHLLFKGIRCHGV